MSYLPRELQQRCPVCDAGPGQRCRAMNQTAYAKPRRHVHPERRPPRLESLATVKKKMAAALPEEYGRPVIQQRSPHGSYSRYDSGCRCDDCRQAKTAYQRDRCERLRGSLLPGDPRHGTQNAYRVYACRCDICVEYMRSYHASLRERTRLAASREAS